MIQRNKCNGVGGLATSSNLRDSCVPNITNSFRCKDLRLALCITNHDNTPYWVILGQWRLLNSNYQINFICFTLYNYVWSWIEGCAGQRERLLTNVKRRKLKHVTVECPKPSCKKENWYEKRKNWYENRNCTGLQTQKLRFPLWLLRSWAWPSDWYGLSFVDDVWFSLWIIHFNQQICQIRRQYGGIPGTVHGNPQRTR